ncbi:TetR/AcrR family transcriptional regulator [Streptomyces sp. NBC_01089]|uniref:TetR/AcrR family transcriptional regulator n=1 Tax=Streptomyces sp. NBC_01089 TaxID=2903747 RepID=UPI003870010C|nr:TetR/AcrR family transcriptional regulator [Streptomyces sp. NBC_01089]
MPSDGFLRARRPEQKQQRRESILAAARSLALEHGVRRVTLGSVADAVGLAKSNVIRYFGTREEIFLVLAAEDWEEWRREVAARLDAGDEAIGALAESLAERPLFCDLLSQAATILEHNISLDAARTYKLAVLTAISSLSAQVARARPGLTEGECTDLVSTAGALAGMLYPMATPPPVLAELYAQEPRLAAVRPPLLPTLRHTLSALAAGLPAVR